MKRPGSGAILRASFRTLRANPRLLWFPIVTLIGAVVAFGFGATMAWLGSRVSMDPTIDLGPWTMLFAGDPPEGNDAAAWAAYSNTLSRYVAIKEEEAHKAKEQLLVLWTDYFKPKHLADYPDLHTTFWKAAKLCSAVKVEVSAEHADELMDAVKEIHEIFWATKGRDVPWYTAK